MVLGTLSGKDREFAVPKSLLASLPSLYIFKAHDEGVFENYKRHLKNFTHNETTENTIEKTYQATNVIMTVSSVMKFTTIIQKISESIWWNNEAFFLVINTSVEDGCKTSNEFLKVVWSANVLSAIYLCNKGNDQLILYTFNPYTDRAPHIWQKVLTKNTNWTLYQCFLHYGLDLSK